MIQHVKGVFEMYEKVYSVLSNNGFGHFEQQYSFKYMVYVIFYFFCHNYLIDNYGGTLL